MGRGAGASSVAPRQPIASWSKPDEARIRPAVRNAVCGRRAGVGRFVGAGAAERRRVPAHRLTCPATTTTLHTRRRMAPALPPSPATAATSATFTTPPPPPPPPARGGVHAAPLAGRRVRGPDAPGRAPAAVGPRPHARVSGGDGVMGARVRVRVYRTCLPVLGVPRMAMARPNFPLYRRHSCTVPVPPALQVHAA